MAKAPLMMSVSGLRGWVGESLTPAVAAEYAQCFGNWLHEHRRPLAGAHKQSVNYPPHVVIGRDSRPSGSMVESAAVAGLLAAGCRVTTLGIATTPAVALMVDELQADGGMVVTASHNPPHDNGFKAYFEDGGQVVPAARQRSCLRGQR
ncbi:MAG: hypothetical protein HC898_03020, partial [Phycisphaerales bacterium]|nr:hypothetical protein [Phycisphaerales bacterium]